MRAYVQKLRRRRGGWTGRPVGQAGRPQGARSHLRRRVRAAEGQGAEQLILLLMRGAGRTPPPSQLWQVLLETDERGEGVARPGQALADVVDRPRSGRRSGSSSSSQVIGTDTGAPGAARVLNGAHQRLVDGVLRVVQPRPPVSLRHLAGPARRSRASSALLPSRSTPRTCGCPRRSRPWRPAPRSGSPAVPSPSAPPAARGGRGRPGAASPARRPVGRSSRCPGRCRTWPRSARARRRWRSRGGPRRRRSWRPTPAPPPRPARGSARPRPGGRPG